jgi:hypothetical protein
MVTIAFRKAAEQHGWPVSMPYECAVALFSDERVAAARAYLEANRGRFKVKNKGSEPRPSPASAARGAGGGDQAAEKE